MIDKIVIELGSDGEFNMDIGGVRIFSTMYWQEVVIEVKDNLKHLAYFDKNQPEPIIPVPYEKLNKNSSKNKSKRQINDNGTVK